MMQKETKQYRGSSKGSPILQFLYTHPLGRLMLKALVRREVSQRRGPYSVPPFPVWRSAPLSKR